MTMKEVMNSRRGQAFTQQVQLSVKQTAEAGSYGTVTGIRQVRLLGARHSIVEFGRLGPPRHREATFRCFELGGLRAAQRFPSFCGFRSAIRPGQLCLPSFDGFCSAAGRVVSRRRSGSAVWSAASCVVSRSESASAVCSERKPRRFPT